jgi:flagella basal body P-ring formation protein FlgA
MKDIAIIRRIDVRTMLLAVALTAAAVSQSHAAAAVSQAHANAPEPRPQVVLSGSTLTVGDVFSDAGEDAGKYLAPAPAIGKKIILSSSDLQRISNAFALGWQADNMPRQTIVRAHGVEIDRFKIQAAVQEKMRDQLPGQKFELDISDAASFVTGDETAAVTVENLKIDMARGEFRARVNAGAEGRDVAGRIVPLMEIPVLARALRNGDIIQPADITFIDMQSKDVSANMVVDAARLAGQTPRRGLTAMKPVMDGETMMPLMVKKGDIVTMALDTGVVQLTVQGRAMADGAVGDVVRVMNTSSNKIIEAVVSGERRVAVGGSTSTDVM